ncbi:Ubiquitinyl hydrolase 1 [Ascochyta rabiei]|uniref:Ubiquitin carboxyl-terminal hydrolase n=1 Tax=Didymella rabiei TaxID=5454 RepID=A0A163FVE0_DIDRA|nr:Ubiquitinyl hydrolase 1 [Ascochyta rabiei]KZM24554.1 ubiquitin-specific protease [Ascochyta rabiei]UPX18298.1 Ubiquitinyl hydrolase 1 [Ascochyta rabiei]
MSGYTKHFVPLESNPDVFTLLIHQLGVSEALSFQEVLSLNDVASFPRPALALILIFPTSETYETHRSIEDADREENTGPDADGTIWFKQTINNACGLYAILHAVCNGDAVSFIDPDSLLAELLRHRNVPPRDFARTLEASARLEETYSKAAMAGDSNVPEDAEEEVDYHYVCFVKNRHSHILELDGDRKGPIDKGPLLNHDDDLLSEASMAVVRGYIERERGHNLGFNLMALVRTARD